MLTEVYLSLQPSFPNPFAVGFGRKQPWHNEVFHRSPATFRQEEQSNHDSEPARNNSGEKQQSLE